MKNNRTNLWMRKNVVCDLLMGTMRSVHVSVLSSSDQAYAPHVTSNKYFTSQGLYTRFKGCPVFLCPHAAIVFHTASRAFGVASQSHPTGTVAGDATFFFDERPRAWYLKERDACRHPWKTSKQGVSTDAKISPKMAPPHSTFTHGDARVCRACEKCGADTVSSKSRNLSTQTDPTAVSTVHLSGRGHKIDSRGEQPKGEQQCLSENIGCRYRCFFC